jgi:WD40 repeat protein
MSKSPPKSRPFDRDLAVVIGINQYQEFPELKTARSDAERLAGILQTNYDYEVKLFIDEQATSVNIQNHLKTELATKIESCKSKHQKVRVLFYFAGHGTPPQGDDYEGGSLVPQDAQTRKTDKWLAMNDIKELLTHLNCDHLLIILDCCYAGSFRLIARKFEAIQDEEISRERYDNYLKFRAGQVIASTAHDETAMDAYAFTDNRGIGKNSHHSPFAELLFQALAPEDEAFTQAGTIGVADYNKDGITTATDLSAYLSDNLGKLTNDRQVSRTWCLPSLDKGEFFFQTGEFDPDKLPGAIILNQENNPYRGLKSFEEAHSRFFFGRNQAIENLEQHLNSTDRPLTVVLGISGSGKSSLVKAGLIPKLREHPTQWRILEPMRPGATPFAALARAVLPLILKSRHLDLEPLKQLDELLRSERKQSPDDKELKDLFAKWRRTAPEDKLFLIIQHFDRFKKLCGADLALQQSLADLRQLGSEHSKLVLDNYDELKKYSDPVKLDSFYHNCQEKIQEWSQSKTWQQDGKQLCELIDKNCPKKQKILLVIDQFEELITQCKQEERQEFLNTLQTALAACPQQLRLVLTLRDDFKHDFENSAQLQKYWQKACFPVAQMGRDELRETIEQPAAAQVLIFDHEERGGKTLVDRLLDDIGDTIGALPLLSFMLSELYYKYVTKARADRTLRWEDYDELGNVTKALTRKATEEYDRLKYDSIDRDGKVDKIEVDSLKTQARQTMLRWVILRMVNMNGGEITKRPVLLETELRYADTETDARCQLVIDRFVDARLLVIGTNLEGKYVEPAHDVLIREWDKIKTWLSGTQQQVNQTQKQPTFDINLQRRLTAAATEWDSIKNQDKAQPKGVLDRVAPIFDWLDRQLLPIENKFNFILNKIPAQFARLSQNQQERFLWNADPYLDVLDRELKSDDNWLNQVEAEFVQKSVLQKRQNISRGWRIAIAVILVLSGLLLFALNRQRETEINQIHALLESSEAQFNSNQTLNARTNSLRAGIALKQSFWATIFPDIVLRNQVRSKLFQAIYTGQEINRLESSNLLVRSVAFSPNGKLLATVGDDKTVRLWNTSGKQLAVLQGHNEKVDSVAFSPDGKLLASSGHDGNVRLWKTSGEKKQLLEFKVGKGPGNWVYSIAFSPNSKLLASGSAEGVHLWDTSGKQLAVLQGHQTLTSSVAFSPDGKLLATGGNDKTVRLWNTSGKQLAVFQAHQGQLGSVAFSPDGKLIATGGNDKTVRLWNTSGKQLAVLQGHNKKVDSVAFSPDGKLLASASYDNTVRLWNTSGKQLAVIEGHTGPVRSVAFNRDSNLLATCGHDGTIRLWDISDQPLVKLKGHNKSVAFSQNGLIATSGDYSTAYLLDTSGQQLVELKGHQGQINSVVFSPNGKLLATIETDVPGTDYSIVHLWNTSGNQLVELKGHQGRINSVVFSPDGKLIATVGDDKTARLWDISGKQLTVLEGNVSSVTFSPDGKLIATVGDDKTARLWDISGKQLVELKGHQGNVSSVTFSPDSKLIATGGDDGIVRLWSTSGQKLLELKGHQDRFSGGFNRVVFSPDGKLLATSPRTQFGTVRLWKTSGQQVVELRRDQEDMRSSAGVDNVAFSPDGKFLVTGDSTDPVRLWNTSGKQLVELKGHRAEYVAFSPDGKLLVTRDSSDTVRLWDTSGKQLVELKGYRAKNVAFSPDGKLLAIGVVKDTVRLWDTSGQQKKELNAHQSQLGSVMFSPDGKQLAILEPNPNFDDKVIRLLDTSGQQLALLEGFNLAFSPDGKFLATARKNGTVQLWDSSGTKLAVLQGHKEPIRIVLFSPDGKLIATGADDGTVRLWDTSGQQLAVLQGHKQQSIISTVAFSPDGKLIATGGHDGSAYLWNTSGRQLAVLQEHQDLVQSLAFSPDGKFLVSDGNNGEARLWNTCGKLLAKLYGSQGVVYGGIRKVAFSPDSQFLATTETTEYDGFLRLWDTSGKQLAKIKPNGLETSSHLAFSPDAKFVATLGENGIIRLWQVGGLDKLIAMNCELVSGYLKNNINVGESDKHLCDGIVTPEQPQKINKDKTALLN